MVVLRSGAHLLKHQLLCRAAAQHSLDFVDQAGAADQITIGRRQLHGVAKLSPTVRDNADFMDRIGIFAVLRHDSGPRLVERNPAFFVIA